MAEARAGVGVQSGPAISAVDLLHRLAHGHEAAVGAGNAAADEHEVALGVDAHDPEVLHGDALGAHVAGHLLALEHVARGEAGADGAAVPEELVRTVGTLEALRSGGAA